MNVNTNVYAVSLFIKIVLNVIIMNFGHGRFSLYVHNIRCLSW